MRVRFEGEGTFDAVRARGRYILAFWHSRFVLMPWAYPTGASWCW